MCRKTRTKICRKTRKIKGGSSDARVSFNEMSDIVANFIKFDFSKNPENRNESDAANIYPNGRQPITHEEEKVLLDVARMLSGNNESCTSSCKFYNFTCRTSCNARKYYLYTELNKKYELLLEKYGMTDDIRTLMIHSNWGQRTRDKFNKEIFRTISPQLYTLKEIKFIDIVEMALPSLLHKHTAESFNDKDTQLKINKAWSEWNTKNPS
jgi:hypothetical protein